MAKRKPDNKDGKNKEGSKNKDSCFQLDLFSFEEPKKEKFKPDIRKFKHVDIW